MNDLPNKIICVFLNKQILTLKDSDISLSLVAEGIQCYVENVRRIAQHLSPGLFQLSTNPDKSMIITVEPKMDICSEFLAGRCHLTVKKCDKLHLCREFDCCTIPNCHYPHDFNRGQNRNILVENNCQNLDCQLLVRLIRLKKNLTRSSSFSMPQKSQELSKSNDIDRQIDISYPSNDSEENIDMEVIELMLSLNEIRIEKKLNECANDFFRRITVQLKRIEDVEKSLQNLNSRHPNTKFKRTKQLIDKSSFKLKLSLDNLSDKISENKIRLYISLLLTNNEKSFTFYDLSTNTEQIYLVLCQHEIDFDKVQQQYQSKRTLQNKEISYNQVYECDQVKISFLDQSKSMNQNEIERLIPSARKDIFTYEIPEENSVEIEFISSQIFKQWLLMCEQLIQKFQVKITPIANDIQEENETIVETIPFHLNPSKLTKIILRSDWAMVAAHPIFAAEYKDYIHEQLGGEIEINGENVSYTGQFPRLPRCPTNESILSNKTNNYMQKLRYQTFRDLKPYHVRILRENAMIVAFNRQNRNDYVVAAKPEDMFELKRKLFPKSRQTTEQTHLIDNERMSLLRATSSLSSSTHSLVESCEKSNEVVKKSPELISTTFPLTTSEQISMFTIHSFEQRLQKHLEEIFNVKLTIERNAYGDKTKGEKIRIMIKISGQTEDVDRAVDELTNLFWALKTRRFDDKNDGNWTKIDEAIEILQHHFSLNNLTCSCQKVSPTCIHINYFDMANPQFGIDEQQIEEIINNQFSSASVSLHQQSNSGGQFLEEWTNLEEKIRQRDDYRKNICLSKESNSTYLFGLTKLVKEFRQLFEQIKTKFNPQTCQIKFSDKQMKYLSQIAHDDVTKLAQQYQSDGCDISLIRLQQNGEFLAPVDLHSTIKDSLQSLVQIEELTFEIKNNAFATLIDQEPDRLRSIVKSKCYLEIKQQKQQIQLSVPKARAADLEERVTPSTASSIAPASTATIAKIKNSTIKIVLGDLTKQTVDVIVVCHTSEYLRKAIIKSAGANVQAEYDLAMASGQSPKVTSNGILPCKKILYLSWKVDKSEASQLQPSLEKFISRAISYASKNGYTSLAFPSVGCGQLGFDPSIIAQHMINSALIELKQLNSNMEVSFVIFANQQNVYDEFVKYLNTLSPTAKPPPLPNLTNPKLKLPYVERTVQIILLSTNKNQLIKCKAQILELSNTFTLTKQVKDKNMIDWSQGTIDEYYKFCLQHDVIPKLDLEACTLDLDGPKDAVHEAENYYYQLTTETFKEARMHAVSRGVIWSVENIPNSNIWEQYSYKLNGIIEDAFLKKLAHVDFVNDKQERCRIVFKLNQEQHETDTRRIRRKEVDSSLPDIWDPSDQNCIRITLQPSSNEYKDVLKQFDVTMIRQYNQIIKIERIQNVRWYKQYAAHRDDHKQKYGKLDERLLFHGCLGDSAQKIIQECFNRSFAGVNGVAYGCGVYFHTDASYSHGYAKPSPPSNGRTMFLARVLIGKTCPGNPSMKTPPPGFDTTTDGKNIFVVYHDAGAYAEHLITYK